MITNVQHCTWPSLSPCHLQEFGITDVHHCTSPSLSPSHLQKCWFTDVNHCTWPSLSASHLQDCRYYSFAPLHLPLPVSLSLTGVSALQICTPVPGLLCLPLICKSVMITDVHHCTWPSLSPSQRQEGHFYRCASLHLAFSVSLTCRSVRITDVHLYTWPSFFPSHLHEWTPLVNENRAPNIFSV